MRLFVAIDISPEVRDAITKIMATLRPEAAGGRWSAPESMHVTLKFLGHADQQKIPQITAALEKINSHIPVSLRFHGLGFFPDDKRPRIMWCGVEATPNLSALASSIEKSLQPLGFDPETRPFVPHVTLARLKSVHGVEKLVRAAAPLKSYDFGAARESQFHVFESVPKKSGSEYKKLTTLSFVKGAQ
jgi:RNA 2',3'-cyclic 3'-phosphodiesterase